jgi:hypothetical protein
MIRTTISILGLALVLAAGCTRKQEPPAPAPAPEPAQPASPAAPAEQPPAGSPTSRPGTPHQSTGKPSRPTSPKSSPGHAPSQQEPPAASRTPSEPPPPPPPPPPRRPTMALVASGTQLQVRLSQPLSASRNHSGDRFETVLDQDVEVDGNVVIPRGTAVTGRVTDSDPSGRIKGRARMSLALSEIALGGQTYPIRTNTLALEADPTKKRDAAKVGGGAALGAIIGAIAGGGKGAAIGAAAGGAAGIGTVLATRGKDLELEAEQRLAFQLENDVRVRTGAFEPQSQAASANDRGGDAQARVERKMRRLQDAVPNWVRNGGDQRKAQSLMDEINRLLQSGQLREAEERIDQGLVMVGAR